MSHTDLRQFLDYLYEHRELARLPGPVDPLFEVASYIRKSSDVQGPAFLFDKAHGSEMRVAGGLFSSPVKAELALQADGPREALEQFMNGLENPLPPVVVDDAPCQEVRLTGDDVDLTKLPIPTYSEQDPGPFVTVGVEIAKDPETGIPNAGMYRMQLFGPKTMALAASPYSDFDAIRTRAQERNERLELAVAIGVDPMVQLATQARVPLGVDELAIAGGLHGAPLQVVPCLTVDLLVPATSEIVLEGYIEPGERIEEGPFGEMTGYVGPGGQEPIFHCTAITTRHDPIYQAGLTGIPVTENHVLKMLPMEANLFRALKQIYPDVTGVRYAPEGGAEFLAVVGLKQRYVNQAKNVVLSALGSVAHPKMVIVVDDDIDIYDSTRVWWAMLTRSQPADDVLIVPRAAGGQLDPSAPSKFGSSLIGIDATIPYGEDFAEVVRVPGVDEVPEWSTGLRPQ